MSAPRLWIIVVRARPDVLKHIRGYLRERDDPTITGTLTAGAPPDPLPFLGVRNVWGKGVMSAPIPALGGDKLIAFGVWESVLPVASQTILDAKETQFPTMIRTLKQQGTTDGQGNFTPTETVPEFKQRAMALVGWIVATP